MKTVISPERTVYNLIRRIIDKDETSLPISIDYEARVREMKQILAQLEV